MQRISPCRLLFLLLFLFTFNSFSQETLTPYKGSIIAGTNRKFNITIGKKEAIIGKILSLDDNQIMVKGKNGVTQNIDRSAITNIEEIPFGTIGNAGVGFGVPYGILGFNLELNVLPYLSVTGGLGSTIFAGTGYNVGIKAYLRKPGPVWRPRASAYYGINGILVEDDFEYGEKFSGITLGIGQLWLWQQHGLDFDLMYLVTSELFDYDDSVGKIKISIGYRYAF